MYLTQDVQEWIADLGLELRFGEARNDLKLPGLHITDPDVHELVNACYEAVKDDVKLIVIYLRPLLG